jgi:hypothetical protein
MYELFMLSISTIAIALGCFIMAVNLPAVLAPAFFRRMATGFSRNVPAAWILTAIDVLWVAWIILHASLGRFEPLKPLVYVAAPVSFFAMVFFMDELLAPRALGGLLLLMANPVLNSARWLDTQWRLVMVVIAYVWVIAGITFVLSPFRLRQAAAWGTKTDFRCILGGSIRVLVGAFVLFLGFKVY